MKLLTNTLFGTMLLVSCYLIVLLPSCSLMTFFEQSPEEKRRQHEYNYTYGRIFPAIIKLLRKQHFDVSRSDFKKGVIETHPKLNRGLFVRAFGGGEFRTIIEASLRKSELSATKTIVTLAIIIEKKDDLGDWEEVEVGADQLDLMDSESYESYFYQIEEAVKAERLGKNPLTLKMKVNE